MKPGDLIKVDPVDWADGDEGTRRVLLTAVPTAEMDPKMNPVTGTLYKDEIGLAIAVVFVDRKPTSKWECGGKSLEVLALFGERLGWNSALCFSVVE